MTASEERIEDLEIRLTHQESSILELSQQLYDQRLVIDRLESLVRTMSKRLKDLSPDNADLPPNERPPHY